MKPFQDPNLAVGWVVSKVRPPSYSITVFVKATFALRPGGGAAAWADEPVPVLGDSHFGDDPAKGLRYPSDFAPFKPRADVMLVGTAHAPGGRATAAFPVTLRVGRLAKTLDVFGVRQWQRGLLNSIPGPAEPFTSLPLTYERSWGGPSSKRNPIGRGLWIDELHRIEDPRAPVTAPGGGRAAAAPPAGFGPLMPLWARPDASLGTYDDRWLAERWPWFPEDFDWGFFNAAPRDQQVDGYLRGDEELELTNLHPDHAWYRSRLPGLRARCFIEDRSEAGATRFRDLPLNLDTLWVDADAERLVLVWRGLSEVRSLKLKEVDRLFAVTEPLGEAARSLESLRDAVHRRFLPPEPAAADAQPDDGAAAAAAATAERAAVNREFADAEAQISEMEAETARTRSASAKLSAGMIAAAETAGADAGRITGAAATGSSAPLRSDADAVRGMTDRFREHAEKFAGVDLAAIARSDERLDAAERELRAFESEVDARTQDPAVAGDANPRPAAERIASTSDAGALPKADQDCSGAMLAGVDLSGRDLSGVMLKKASLARANLARANLSGADLSNADLTGADLSGATLDGADLTGATLAGAKLVGASLAFTVAVGADLSGADLSSCIGRGPDFTGCKAAAVPFVRAKLPQANFSQAELTGADFTGAELQAAQFDGAKARGILMSGAELTRLQAGEGADFTNGVFVDAQGPTSVWEKSTLDGADFSRAKMPRAMFGDASLRGAKFDRCDLTKAVFEDAAAAGAALTHSNLVRASFDRADLSGATLGGSNLFEAGFWETTFADTIVEGANLKGTVLRGRRGS